MSSSDSKTPIKVAVLGAGPGGYAAAFYAADLGHGCHAHRRGEEPWRRLPLQGLHPLEGAAPCRQGDRRGTPRHRLGHQLWRAQGGRRQASRLQEPRRREADGRDRSGGEAAEGAATCRAVPRSSMPKTLRVQKAEGGEATVAVDYVVLATGSHPTRIPSLSLDSPRVLDSTSALDLPEIPKTMLVMGGGYIGLELGSVYATLGTRVSVVEMTAGLLPGADRDLVRILNQRAEKVFEKIYLSTKVTAMKAANRRRHRELRGRGRAGRGDLRLRAGRHRPAPQCQHRRARSDPGEGERQGLHRDRRPAPHRRADDVRDRRRRRRADAGAQGVTRSARGHRRHRRPQGGVFEPAAIPAVVFTDPEIAWAGLTEADAEKQGLERRGRAVPLGRLGARHRHRPR